MTAWDLASLWLSPGDPLHLLFATTSTFSFPWLGVATNSPAGQALCLGEQSLLFLGNREEMMKAEI